MLVSVLVSTPSKEPTVLLEHLEFTARLVPTFSRLNPWTPCPFNPLSSVPGYRRQSLLMSFPPRALTCAQKVQGLATLASQRNTRVHHFRMKLTLYPSRYCSKTAFGHSIHFPIRHYHHGTSFPNSCKTSQHRQPSRLLRPITPPPAHLRFHLPRIDKQWYKIWLFPCLQVYPSSHRSMHISDSAYTTQQHVYIAVLLIRILVELGPQFHPVIVSNLVRFTVALAPLRSIAGKRYLETSAGSITFDPINVVKCM